MKKWVVVLLVSLSALIGSAEVVHFTVSSDKTPGWVDFDTAFIDYLDVADLDVPDGYEDRQVLSISEVMIYVEVEPSSSSDICLMGMKIDDKTVLFGAGFDKLSGYLYDYTGRGSRPKIHIYQHPYGNQFWVRKAELRITAELADPIRADAGVNRTVNDSDGNGTEAVTLDGSRSIPATGQTIADYQWTYAGGTTSGVSPTVDFPVGTHVVMLTVQGSGGGTHSDTVSITVTPQNDTLTLTLPERLYEDQLGAKGTISVATAMGANLIVALASADSTVLSVSNTVTLLAGKTSADFTLTLPENSNHDGTRDVSVTASAASLPVTSASTTVQDNEGGVFEFHTAMLCYQPQAGFAEVVVRRSSNTETASVSYSTSGGNPGVEYLATSGTLVFVPGESVKTIAVPILDSAATFSPFSISLDTCSEYAALGQTDSMTIILATIPVNLDLPIALPSADSIDVGDLDGDGDLDMVLALYGYNVVFWWRNEGHGSSWKGFNISNTASGIESVAVADVDGDGDLDVVGAESTGNTVRWWENVNGDATIWTSRTVGSASGATEVAVGDLDDDGDVDIVVSAYNSDSLIWFKNVNGSGTSWQATTITASFDGIYPVHIADIDGDGDLDIAAGAKLADDVAWWENMAGNATAWTRRDVDLNFDGVYAVRSADIDGDGDLDLIGAAGNANDVVWWANPGTPSGSWTKRTIDAEFTGAFSVTAGDFDNDGDIDVAGAAYTADLVSWWENTAGNGQVWNERIACSGFDGAVYVTAADLNNNGVTDIIGAAYNSGKVTISHWPQPPSALVVSPQTVTEGQSVQIRWRLPSPAAADTNLQVVASPAGRVMPMTINISSGQQMVAFSVATIDDDLLNGSEDIDLILTYGGVTKTLTITVLDNETATLSVELPASVTENAGVLTNAGTVRVSQPVGADVTVALSSSDTTELAVPATVVIPSGATSATFNLTVPNDALYDGTQHATVTASVVNWTPGSATTDVLDDDMVLTLALTATVAEGWGACTNSGTVSIPYAATTALTVALSATPGAELTLPATVTIPVGATSIAFSLTPVDDTARDGAQTVTVGAAASGWTSASRALVVQDNEDGLFTFAQTTVSYNLGAGFAILTVSRDSATNAASVDYTTANGTLLAGTHYQAVTGTLHFAAGQTQQTLFVPILTSTAGTLSVRLQNPSAYAGLGRNATATVQISATGTAPGRTYAPVRLIEGETGAVWFCLPQAALTATNLTVTASHPVRLVFPATVAVAAGQQVVLFDLTAVDDALLNGSPTVQITLVCGATTELLTLLVKDNETATLTVELPASVTENAGVLTNAGTVRVSQPVAADVTVGLSSSDTTELQVPATVVIPAGATSVPFNLTVPNDTLYDGTQGATVTASVANWTPGSVAIAVLDDDMVLTLALTATVAEGWGVCTNVGTVSIPYAAPTALTVALAAVPGAEVTLPAIVTIPAGATSVAFNLTPVDDTARDGAQTVTVTASLTGWTSASRPFVVQDNEDGLFGFAQPTVTYNLGSGFAIVTVTRTGAANPASVDYTTVNGTFLAGTHYQAVTGTLHFAAGQTQQMLLVPILSGTAGTFSMRLQSSSANAGLGRNGAVIITLSSVMTKHSVDAEFNGAWAVCTADMDGDGDTDIAAASREGKEVCLWGNVDGKGKMWNRFTVAGNTGSGSAFMGSIYASDLDSDGDVDILFAEESAGLYWRENTAGNGTAWIKRTVDAAFNGTMSVYAVDLDGDGDLDILAATSYSDAICWWENTAGNGTAWTKRTVDAAFDGAHSVYAADMDGDGDLDIVGAAKYADDICWWENTAGNGTAWTKRTVDAAFDGAQSVYAADLDGDGDLDILGAALDASAICWWENTAGNGTAWTKRTVDAAFGGAISVHAADVDGDGDSDILGAAIHADAICWWENTGGNGTVWTKHTLDAAFDGANSVYAADVDRDGDLDILGTALLLDDVCWWENHDTPSSLYAPAQLMEGAPGAVWFCLPQPAVSGTNLTVTVTRPDRLTAPQTVPVAAGQQVVSFLITAVDDALLNGSSEMQINVSDETTSVSSSILIHDNDSATLTVASAHGTPVPGIGTHPYLWEASASVECRVSSVESIAPGTQYLCTGWAGAGSVPASGATTNVSFAITENSSIVWNWATNYWLEIEVVSNGTVDAASGWQAAGSSVTITAMPVANHRFVEWLGDTGAISGGALSSTSVTVSMAGPVSLTATFAPTHLVTLHPGDHGSIPDANSGSSYVTNVAHGAAFPAVQVLRDAGWTFTGWNPSAPATVTNDFEATARYTANPFATGSSVIIVR